MRANINLNLLGRDASGHFRSFPKDIYTDEQYVMPWLQKTWWNGSIQHQWNYSVILMMCYQPDSPADLEQCAPALIKHLESCELAVKATEIPSMKGWIQCWEVVLWVVNEKPCRCGVAPVGALLHPTIGSNSSTTDGGLDLAMEDKGTSHEVGDFSSLVGARTATWIPGCTLGDECLVPCVQVKFPVLGTGFCYVLEE